MVDRTAPTVVVALLVVACADCRCSHPPPIDDVARIPETGPLVVLTGGCVVDGDDKRRCGPLLVDPESGATHVLTRVDDTCAGILSFGDSLRVTDVKAWSPGTQRFYAYPTSQPGGHDDPIALLSLGLDGHCDVLWREPPQQVDVRTLTVSADGATVARSRAWTMELCAPDGSAPRPLAWSKALDFDTGNVTFSPNADRVALAQMDGKGPDYHSIVHMCDLAGACTVVHRADSAVSELQWSPDGVRLAFIGQDFIHQDTLFILDVSAVPGGRAVPVEVHLAFAERGRLHHVAWSPDGRRLALVSSHEGGCTADVRDAGSTCYEGLYVLGADGHGIRRVRSELRDADRMWWIR